MGKNLKRFSRAVAAILVASTCIVGGFNNARALVIDPFAQQISINTTGGIEIIGNASMTCRTAETNCIAARAGSATGNIRNNQFDMTYVDVDSDPSTFSSSTSTLALPAGSRVVYASLNWGGEPTAGTKVGNVSGVAAPAPANANRVRLKAPGATSYSTITADYFKQTGRNDYTGYKDITSLLPSSPEGEWTVADIQSGQGGNRYGGWGLTVVYENPSLPLRNLTVTRGFVKVDSADNLIRIPVSGFTTPPTGPVRTRLGAIATEGDRGSTGDFFELNGTKLSDATRPIDDFFNSSITRFGTSVTDRNPTYNNVLGFDIAQMDVGGLLGNNATSASLAFGTRPSVGETYFPTVLTFQTDIFSPRIDLTKSALDLNGAPLKVGDTVRFSINGINNGDDAAVQTALTDELPAGLTPVPDSLKVSGSSVTDAAADDTGEVVGQTVTARVGTNATGSRGGRVEKGSTVSIVVDATVDAGLPDGTVLSNYASANFRGATDNNPVQSLSNEVQVVVNNPSADLSISKSTGATTTPGGSAVYSITVTNNGPQNSDGPIRVVDTLPVGYPVASAEGSGWTCSVTGGTLDCIRTATLASGESTPSISLALAVPTDATGDITNAASVTGVTPDPNPANNSDSATSSLVPSADLGVAISHSGNPTAGGTVRFQVDSVANGPSAAADASLRIELPDGITPSAVTGDGWTCGIAGQIVTCSRSGPIGPGTSLPQVVVDAAISGSSLSSTAVATISGSTADSVAANNVATDLVEPRLETDLVLDKVHTNAGPFTVLNPPTYRLRVGNGGPSSVPAGTPTRIVDTLPAGLHLAVGTVSAPWSCTEGITAVNGTTPLVCDLTTAAVVNAGTNLDDLTFDTTVDGSVSGTAINSATLTLPSDPTLDPNPANNTSTDQLDIERDADLQITVSAPGGPLVAGDPTSVATATWAVANNGGSDDPGPITVRGSIASGLSFTTSPNGPGWSCVTTGNSFECTRAAGLANGDSDTSLTAVVTAVTGTTVSSQTLSGQVSSSTTDSVPANDVAETAIGVDNLSDMTVSVTVNGPLVAGQQGTATVIATNNGPSPAAGVSVAIALPEGVTGIEVAPGASCEIVGRTAVCTFATAVESGASAPEITLTFAIPAYGSGAVTVNATVSSSTFDTVLDNNTASDSALITQSFDLATSLLPQGTFLPGSSVTAEVTVTNNGPSNSSVVLNIPVPAGTTILAASGEGWTCDISVDPISCAASDQVGPGTSTPTLVVTVQTEPSSITDINWSASACAPAGITPGSVCPGDTDPANNDATGLSIATLLANLQTTKQVVGTLTAGAPATWTIDVTNLGPTDDPGPFQVVDNMPTGASPTSATGDGWTCEIAGQTVTCASANSLSNGATLPTITVVGLVADGVTGALTNVATATSPAPDPDPSIASAQATAEVGAATTTTSTTTTPATSPSTTSGTGDSGTNTPTGSTPTDAANAGSLATTGGDQLPIAILGFCLLGIGAALLARRGRSNRRLSN